jgi:diphthine-ammonia ligase
MKTVVLYSGGKDSTYAIYWTVNQAWDIRSLVSVIPGSEESFMFHYPNLELAGKLAECMELPIIIRKSKGEDELCDLKEALSSLDADAVVSGVLASEYQKTRIDGICHDLGLRSFSPLWHKDPEKLLRDMVDAGFEITVTGVAAEGMGKEWLGMRIDNKAIEELCKLKKRYGLHIAGEGGEWESLVTYAPSLFKRRLEIKSAEKVWKGTHGYLKVKGR